MGIYCGWEAKSLTIVFFISKLKEKTLHYNNKEKAAILIEYFSRCL